MEKLLQLMQIIKIHVKIIDKNRFVNPRTLHILYHDLVKRSPWLIPVMKSYKPHVELEI